ncbi:MAG: hypothetical protein DLM65_15220 [Candidatus Aeolococcus gillhamiae]|nr:MAG: hypothetical protein DLM65_15220 [Candidatus Dormibacter sp. RRmetagenome_bin12]
MPWSSERFVGDIVARLPEWRWEAGERQRMERRVAHLTAALGVLWGETTQDRWVCFEETVWPQWIAGGESLNGNLWRWGTWGAVLTRTVQPSWTFVSTGRISQWTQRLPADDALRIASDEMRGLLAELNWVDDPARDSARWTALRLLLCHGLARVEDITDDHIQALPRTKGLDTLDGALCHAGILNHGPARGATRKARRRQLTTAEMVAGANIPERFRPVTVDYLEEYRTRVAPAYSTLRSTAIALGHWWRYIDQEFPSVRFCSDVRADHARGFLEWAKLRARAVRRRGGDDDGTHERGTAHVWVLKVRVFFADLTCWAAEEGSPFTEVTPPFNPLGRRDMVSLEPAKIRRQTQARIAATVFELERELPKIRAYALRTWQAADDSHQAQTPAATRAFWDWALLELLVLSGLRIEEACELTTLDVLRRQLSDGRRYYLLHVKPSKYDRARVIPIGDGLGRVIAEIVRHVRAFYGAAIVPPVRAWDSHEKRWRPSAPYLLQTAAGHPSVIDEGTIRARLARLSRAAEACRANGQPLVLRPHDCRRMFASEHLNNSTPPHVIQALLGHATIDTVLIYAKLYPTTLVEEYRKTLHGIYHRFGGTDAFKNPTCEEWRALDQACSMRDMGTHMCALPTGQHCPKGLVCLGCGHAQPKKSAVPIFRGMLTSHLRVLEVGRHAAEPAGQIAARELEVERIRSALRRAEELTDDVAAAIESSA